MSISKLTAKVIGDKRRWRKYKARTRELPDSYRATVEALQRYLMAFGPTDGDSAASMFEDLVELFEQGAADGTPVRAVVGEDPLEFVEAFLRNYPEGWMSKERQRLVNAIDRAAGDRAAGDASAPGRAV
jgi:DNA-binding ferritin-like protein (Dps family)